MEDIGHATAEKKAALEQHLMQSVNKISDAVVRQHMRDYIKGQLFALKGRAKDKKQVLPELRPAALPDAHDTVLHLIRLEEQIAAIILLHPDIMHQADIEEYFAHMDLTHATLDKLRCGVLEITSAAQSIDHASLCAALAERGLNEKVKTLLHSTNGLQPKLRAEIMNNPHSAVQAFIDTRHAYTAKKLELEISRAASKLEEDGSEESQDLLISLQKQKDELQRSLYAVASEE